jgi:hypothetical protein
MKEMKKADNKTGPISWNHERYFGSRTECKVPSSQTSKPGD